MRALGAFVLVVSCLVAPSSAANEHSGPTRVIATKAPELQAVAGDGYMAWIRFVRKKGWQLYVRSPAGDVSHVNRPRTEAMIGAIADGRLVFQEYTRRHSTIRLMDLATGKTWDAPGSVNKRGTWEYWPVMSDKWLIFARFYPRLGISRVHALDLSSKRLRMLWEDQDPTTPTYIQPGQTRGNYFVMVEWDRGYQSQLVVFDLEDRYARSIKRRRGDLWAPSIRSDGTVYAIATNKRCGSNPRLLRYSRDFQSSLVGYDFDEPTMLAHLGEGFDSFNTYAYTDEAGNEKVLFQRAKCTNRLGTSDIWSYQDMVPLTVVKEGLGLGTVTSSPTGISCSDGECSSMFPGGAEVTLTAEPLPGSSFESWYQACHGSHEICILRLDDEERAVAHFEPGL